MMLKIFQVRKAAYSVNQKTLKAKQQKINLTVVNMTYNLHVGEQHL